MEKGPKIVLGIGIAVIILGVAVGLLLFPAVVNKKIKSVSF